MKEQRKHSSQAGFTLIEVLLVVVIIGILVAVAVPKLGGRVKESKIAAARMEVKSIATAISMYEVDNGSYPASLQNLVTSSGNAKNWKGPYIEDTKDPWGNDYQYTVSENTLEVKTVDPDGKEISNRKAGN